MITTTRWTFISSGEQRFGVGPNSKADLINVTVDGDDLALELDHEEAEAVGQALIKAAAEMREATP